MINLTFGTRLRVVIACVFALSLSTWAACPTQVNVSGSLDIVAGAFGPGVASGYLALGPLNPDASCSYQITFSGNWLTFSPSSGTLNATAIFLNYAGQPNNTTSVRSGQIAITVNGVTIYTSSVTQNTTSCTYTPVSPVINVPAAGGVASYQVNTFPANCYIFFSVSPSGDNFFGSTSYNVPANSGPARSWLIAHGYDHNATGGLVTINQAAAGITGGLALVCNPNYGPQATNAYRESPYRSTCNASGGTSPYAWSIATGSLPQGLTLSPSGSTATIQGTSPIPGPYQYTVKVSDSSNPVQTAVLRFNGGQSPAPLVATFPSPPPPQTNVSFGSHGNVEGGTPGYTWSVSAGTLPPDVRLTSNGSDVLISGALNTPSQYNYTLRVQDSGQPPQVATQTYSGAITLAPVSIRTNSLPAGRVNQPYLSELDVTGGVPPYSWSVASGTVPLGTHVNPADGATSVLADVFGTPTTEGSYNFTLRATDSASPPNSTLKAFTIVITQGLRMSCAPPVGENVVGAPFSFTCTAVSNELPPFYWAQLDGSLPTGVSFPESNSSSTLTVSGIPTAPGPFRSTVVAGKDLRNGTPPLLANTVVSGTIAPPSLIAAPTFLAFRSSTSAGAPPDQVITVSGAPSKTAFTVKVSAGAQWLSARVLNGSLPGSISVSANPQNLAPGRIQHGQITVQAGNGTEAVVNVTFAFETSSPGNFSVVPAQVTLTSAAAGPPPGGRIQVVNSGGGSGGYTISAAAPWLTLGANGGMATSTSPDWIDITPSVAALSPGTYRTQVVLAAADDTQSIVVPVTLSLANSAQLIQLLPHALDITVSAAAASSPVSVRNDGQGNLGWNAVARTADGAPWLNVFPPSGISAAAPAASAPITVSADPRGLSPGRWYGSVQATASSAANSPQLASVRLNVVDPATSEPPLPSVSGILLTGSFANITLRNLQSRAADFTVQAVTDDGPTWLNVTAAASTVPPLSTTVLSAGANFAGLAPGVRTGKIQLNFAGGTRVIAVTAINANAMCQPTTLVPVLTSLPPLFGITVGRPTPLIVKVADDCGNPMIAGGVSATFDDADAPLNFTSTADGWMATWIPRAASVVNITVWAFTTASGQRLTGSAPITGIVSADPAAPAVISGIVNSASFLSPGQAAPGSWISIFGDRLSTSESADSIFPYPTVRAGTKVWLGASLLPLSYAAPGLVNALVPYSAVLNSTQSVIIERDGTVSAPAAIAVTDALPAIYTTNGQGFGQGAIVIASTGAIAANDPTLPGSRPASHGEYLAIFCSGLGPVDNAPPDNQPAPISPPLATVKKTPQVTIGGVGATVTYAGLAPGQVGLYQVNVQIPDAAPAGDHVPIQVIVGDAGSNVATIAIQ